MRFHLGLLPLVLVLSTAATVRPPSWEAEYRRARNASVFETPQAALEIVESVLSRAGISNDPWVVALRLYRAELRALLKGEYKGALPILERPLPDPLRKTEIEMRRLGGLAMVLNTLGSSAEACAITHRMVALASKDVPAMAAYAYYMRGNVCVKEADIRTAIRLAREQGDETLALRSEALLVRAFEWSGKYVESVEVGEKVLPRMEKAGLSVGTIIGNLGSTYFELGDYESSRDLFLRAEATARRLSTSHDLPVWLDRLGDVSVAMHDLDGAERWYRQAEEYARAREHKQLPRALSNRAYIAIERGQLADARRLIDEGMRIDAKEAEPEDIQRARVVRASLELALRNFDAARKELEDVLARSKDPFTRLRAETGLGRVYAAQKKNELAGKSFARAMRTAVDERDQIHPDYQFSFFNSVEYLSETYVDFLVDTGQIGKALEVTEEIRARTLAEGLGAIGPKKKLDVPAIARRANATILVYWLGTRRSYVWAVTPLGVTIHPLPADAVIERDVEEYQKVLGYGSLSQSAPRGQRLFQTLVAPAVRGVAKESKVIIIADGKLHTLNFETLVVPSPRPHWWIEDVIVTSANSLHLLGRPAAKRKPDQALLLVGDTPRADPAFAPLPNARAEMAKVGAHFPRKKVLSGAAATPKAFLKAGAATFDVIHFVAHGIATRKRPLDSAVILAKDDTDHFRLYARDIVAQHLTARLVTISSCHGAGTRAYAGEGLVGLAWAFLRAGAEQVIAALWEVDDAATTKLMDHMYAQIRAGRDPAVALRAAKLALIQSRTVHQKPKYWAPFVIYAGS